MVKRNLAAVETCKSLSQLLQDFFKKAAYLTKDKGDTYHINCCLIPSINSITSCEWF